MINKTTAILGLFCLLSSLISPINNKEEKKELLQSIANNACSNAKHILKESFVGIDNYCHENSFEAVLKSFPTVVHENYHMLNHHINNNPAKRTYYISNDLEFTLNVHPVVRSEKMHEYVIKHYTEEIPERYYHYIFSDQAHMDSQKSGIYGILEEYAAYYQDMLAYKEMFTYLKTNVPYTETAIWIDYLIANQDVLNASKDFNLFISWYLQYCKINEASIYQTLIKDQKLKDFYSYIHSEFEKSKHEFLNNQEQILRHISAYTDQKDKYIRTKGDKYFYELYQRDHLLDPIDELAMN